MTIERLLECTPEELEKLSDQQLNEFFAPYLKFVRPPCNTTPNPTEVNSRPHGSVTNSISKKRKPNLDQQLEMLEELAKKKGLL